MSIVPVTDPEIIAPLFAGWNETMIWSYLTGCMGWAFAPAGQQAACAQILTADFCFFAGQPSPELAAHRPPQAGEFAILVPQNEAWARCIEAAWAGRAQRRTRYAFYKESAGFDPAALAAMAVPPAPYGLKPIEQAEYEQIMASDWGAADLCGQFADYADYQRRGIGRAILLNGRVVAGASSYTVYKGGIEIEIDTHPAHRRRGLARACGAALILACLEQGLYPSWDAHNPASAALAQSLGYRFEKEYPVYEVAW